MAAVTDDVKQLPVQEVTPVYRSEFQLHLEQDRQEHNELRSSIKELYEVTKENHGIIQGLLRFQARTQVVLGLVTVVGTGIGSLILKLLYDYIKTMTP